MELVLFLRIHAVVIKTRFTDSDDFRIRRDDAPDFLQIRLRRFINHVRMDTGRAKSRVMADKLVDQTILPCFDPVRIQQIPSTAASAMIFSGLGKDRVNKLSPIS